MPQLHVESVEDDAIRNIEEFREQLATWGFMALEVPGIGDRVTELYGAFDAALASTSPSLYEFAVDRVPQASAGGNHGFFRPGSEVPRLANGVADPKEFLHVSGAMLDNHPAGSAALLEAFPALAEQSRFIFELGIRVAASLGDVVREILPGQAPELGLSRHSSILRVIHYQDSQRREILAHEHSGIQMLGVQFPASEGGLQYILNDGTWVEPIIWGTDVLLCNIGRMLSEASGRRVRPSTHRVHRSPMAMSERRWSSVVFVHPDHSGEQWTITEEEQVRMLGEPWGAFVNKGLRELGLSD